MAITADTIGVDIVANINRLDAGLRAAESKVDQSARRMQSKVDGGANGGGFFGPLGMSVGEAKFTRFLAVTALVDRIGSTLNEIFQGVLDRLKDVQRGVMSTGDAIFSGIDSTLGAIPGFGQMFNAGKKLNEIINRAADPDIAASEIADEIIAVGLAAQRDLMTEAERIEYDFQTALGTIKATFDVFNQAAAKVAGTLDEQIRNLAEIDRVRDIVVKAATRKRDEALKKLNNTGSSVFDTGQTVLGTFKSPFTASSSKPATEQTNKEIGKNTKKTASLLERILNKKSGMVEAFA
jgi:hypothetical protein